MLQTSIVRLTRRWYAYVGATQVTIRLFAFKISRRREDFWAWLFRRVAEPKCRDFEKPQLAYFLIVSAIRLREPYRACTAYENFGSLVEGRLSSTDILDLQALARKIGRTAVLELIVPPTDM